MLENEILYQYGSRRLGWQHKHLDAVPDPLSENIYLQQLHDAQKHYGPNSGYCGLILMSLQDFYEKQGRFADAKRAERRINKILISSAEKLVV